MVEGDGVHGPGVHEQDRNRPGVDHRVPGEVLHPGMDPGVFIDERPVPEQAPLLEQVINNIPGEIISSWIAASTVGAVIGPGCFRARIVSWSSRACPQAGGQPELD